MGQSKHPTIVDAEAKRKTYVALQRKLFKLWQSVPEDLLPFVDYPVQRARSYVRDEITRCGFLWLRKRTVRVTRSYGTFSLHCPVHDEEVHRGELTSEKVMVYYTDCCGYIRWSRI